MAAKKIKPAHSKKNNNLTQIAADRENLGTILTFIATFCFGFQSILVKLSYAEETPLTAILLWRALVFLPFFWAAALWKFPRKKIFVRKFDIALCVLAGGVGYFLVPLFSMHALAGIDAVIERTLMFSFPIMVIIINSILERKWPSKSEIGVFAMIWAGTFLLIGGFSDREIFHQNLFGAAEVLLAALIQAFFVILIQTLIRRVGTICFMLWAITGATLIVFIVSIIQWQPADFILTKRSFLFISLLSLMSFPAAMMFAEGVKRIGGSKASLINSATPLVTVLFGYLILDEVLLPSQAVGMAMVILAVLMMQGKSLRMFIRMKR